MPQIVRVASSMFLPLLLFASAVSRAADVSPADWPQFKRDAARTGDNPQAQLTFPLARTTAIRFPSPIYASPAVVNGRVYIQDALGNLAAIDARQNKVLWLAALGGFNNMSSPAVWEGRVYVGSTSGALFVLNADDGQVLARVPAAGGVLASPAVTEAGIYFTTFDGQLTKIDRDGRIVWTYDGGRLSTTEFAVRGDHVLLFAGTKNTYFHLLRDHGDRCEVVSKKAALGNCVPQGGPVLLEDLSFAFQSFDSETGRFYAFGEKPIYANDVCEARITPSIRGGMYYRGDKCWQVDDAGKLKLQWRVDPKVLYDGGFHSSPALAANVLVVGSELGKVHCVPLEGTEKVRQPVWQFTTLGAGEPNGAVSSSPAVVEGAVYFGGEDGILYGLSQGPEVAVVEAPLASVLAAPAESPRLAGSEWHTAGGDMGYSFYSADTLVKPPFEVQWKTRVFSTYKCPMIVADSKVFCTGRGGPLTALDAATGKILWKVHHPGVESRPPATYIDGKLVLMRIRSAQGDSPYVSNASGGPAGEGLWCHDARTGKPLWHVPMAFKYHFNHDGLACADGKVFVADMDEQRQITAVAYSLADGREVWRRPLVELPPQANAVKLPPRFSGVIAGGLWCVSFLDRGTVGLRPETGELAWANPELFITKRTRVAARDNTLVVFAATGDHALEAATGAPLWTGAAKLSPYTQALSNLYLSSRGQQGLYPTATCAWPVHCNGYWFSHDSFSTQHGANRMVCTLPEDPAQNEGFLSSKQAVWGFDFLSNACPTPSPAYGRLYYSPNSEGVVYCFAPQVEKH